VELNLGRDPYHLKYRALTSENPRIGVIMLNAYSTETTDYCLRGLAHNQYHMFIYQRSTCAIIDDNIIRCSLYRVTGAYLYSGQSSDYAKYLRHGFGYDPALTMCIFTCDITARVSAWEK